MRGDGKQPRLRIANHAVHLFPAEPGRGQSPGQAAVLAPEESEVGPGVQDCEAGRDQERVKVCPPAPDKTRKGNDSLGLIEPPAVGRCRSGSCASTGRRPDSKVESIRAKTNRQSREVSITWSAGSRISLGYLPTTAMSPAAVRIIGGRSELEAPDAPDAGKAPGSTHDGPDPVIHRRHPAVLGREEGCHELVLHRDLVPVGSVKVR